MKKQIFQLHKKGIKRFSHITLAALCIFITPSLTYGYDAKMKTVKTETQSPFMKYETKESQKLQDGVTFSRLVYGKTNREDAFMVNVDFLTSNNEAIKLKEKLASQGYDSFIQKINERAQDDPERVPLGYLVRIGPFQAESEAKSLKEELASGGYSDSRVVFTGEDGDATTGPWVVNVLEINPKTFKGHISPVIANDQVPSKEKLTSMSMRMNALAGINGGYFVMGPKDGTEGDLAGISMVDGKLISEAVNGRTSLILNEKNHASISTVNTKLSIQTSDGEKREIDGLNRVPGLIRGCGGVGDKETNQPKHDYTCTDASELIQYSSHFGTNTPSGDGAEAVINSKGIVTEIKDARGGKIPEGSTVLSGTSENARWIHDHLQAGEKVNIKKKMFTEEGSFPSRKGIGIINGGPRLLENKKINIPSTAEGFHQPDNPEFFYQFGQRRHPRTVAGIKADGTILLVTIDGRKPGYSVGANFKESAQLLKSLGAVNALNLDGGGSTTMTVNQKLAGTPSDAAGERPIGDGILLLPQ
ncbi:phosphodiester glycosidase family protein [Metabacillus dongyingensis]|uniref:phosphodiester glycosidase family protein n=1 Tax=Metabacillus dongyingensis TaxID=2874282 RepID=UPI001CBCBC9F|nr:phosphodiester glycosidase family protein [Metabacillus dongyingensis]UAL53444.1 phosphodiester glycosidase family protein [Metabacillus dongyingensis]